MLVRNPCLRASATRRCHSALAPHCRWSELGHSKRLHSTGAWQLQAPPVYGRAKLPPRSRSKWATKGEVIFAFPVVDPFRSCWRLGSVLTLRKVSGRELVAAEAPLSRPATRGKRRAY